MASAPQPSRTAATAAPKVVATPDYVAESNKADAAVINKIAKNPIYQMVYESGKPKEELIPMVVNYLMAGAKEGTLSEADIDLRRQQLIELNDSIQVLRKQLGSEQAVAITSKAYADFQKIVDDTRGDVEKFEEELAPLCGLAELFSKYGADGNIIEKLQIATVQKREREHRIVDWTNTHNSELMALRLKIDRLTLKISEDEETLSTKWIGKNAFAAGIATSKQELVTLKAQLSELEEKKPEITIDQDGVEQVDEKILQLQNIGGESFKEAMISLRDHTQEALAKISMNFDSAVNGLENSRESFITMDRNCGDAAFALLIIQEAVKQAETQTREIAEGIIKKEPTGSGNMAELDRMEREQESNKILTYTASLTSFLTNVSVAVTSLRSSQSVIKNILQMNAVALQSANTHKITGMANTADAVTITIGSIIEVCNRAASRALSDGLTRMRTLAQRGSDRLTGGISETLDQQNEQLADFRDAVEHLKSRTLEISTNTIGALQKQFQIIADMNKESGLLADATANAERASFNARAGIGAEAPTAKTDEPTTAGFRFGRIARQTEHG